MKKTLSLALISITAMMNVFAQKNSFGILNYTITSEYKVTKSSDILTYSKLNKNTGAFCLFLVYKVMDAQGNTRQCFDYYWRKLVQEPNNTTVEAVTQPETEIKGWHLLMGNATYVQNNVNTLALQFTFTGENKMQNVIILSNSNAYQKDIEDFIASADVIRTAKIPESMPVKPKEPFAVKNQTAAPTKNIKYEVWECNCGNLETGTLIVTKLNTVILSPDGKYLTYMPEKGLNGITPQNSNETGSWGSVTDKGNMLSLVNENYKTKMELYKMDANTLSRYPNSKSSIYKKVKPADGLQFEGAYSPELSYYTGKSDMISNQIDPGKRPIIFFKKDGTYINEGISFSNITYGDDFAIGKGTYEIINYSLILTTQSGRKLQVAFTPILDANPANADNPGFIINNKLWYKLSKQFVPHN